MAKQMIYTARNINAADAYRIGLVNEVYSAEVDADGNVVKSAQEVMLAAAQKMAATCLLYTSMAENTVIREIFIYKERVFVLYIADSSCTD